MLLPILASDGPIGKRLTGRSKLAYRIVINLVRCCRRAPVAVGERQLNGAGKRQRGAATKQVGLRSLIVGLERLS